ncbi:UDP-N-acetylmuramoylalanyl-D-glutamate--2,6-diaminopimelate ligase [Marichromatium purpuratum 984]|uniref:UDP-N-acetylmuramoyl-L-alanyl-D-glutamate--2,6-diaminopimelate ligase n=1 Tax=Marichromatium purpuratum 984 TaxID=765910 RepID=W0E1Y8_MARPU|nr:UDP-N-acetylmuramoyl-L-alanyl-D-glutamate--2,6-diaminopimelate ligase [Marichromatium purpuratum]AHF04880.1 UDP-N-acetylmuramoylalanyl-D-glutamate--2,6-diaminopimelate ligase [Marichromatium purpuratum 984]
MIALSSTACAWRLGDLIDGVAEAGDAADRPVCSIALDSRMLSQGALFLACQGGSLHGLAFAQEAKHRGATAILAEISADWPVEAILDLGACLGLPVIPVEGLAARASALAARFYGAPSERLELFGVTGTNGKTSVSHFLAQALAPELDCAVIGTLGNGFPGALRSPTHTTPDAISLQALLESLRAQGARAVAMEVSSHALDQGRTSAARFSHAVFTNLSRDHLDYHGDMTAYGEAKRRLFLSPGLQWAVLNLDDPFSARLLETLAPEVQVAGYGIDPEGPTPSRCALRLRALAIEPRPHSLYLHVESRTTRRTERAELEVGLIGRFNAANLLAVLAVMCSRGLPLERAVRELARIRGVPGRMECFGGSDAPLVVVDYAHTPDALEKALVNVREHTSGRLITVFGCGGDRDRGKRPLMGSIAESLSDGLILTDDNPRTESPEAIVADILEGVGERERVRVEHQRGLAIRLAIALAGRGDAVVVAGKGHETYQDMGDLKRRFSDRAQAVEALREWREGHH